MLTPRRIKPDGSADPHRRVQIAQPFAEVVARCSSKAGSYGDACGRASPALPNIPQRPARSHLKLPARAPHLCASPDDAGQAKPKVAPDGLCATFGLDFR